MRNKVLSLLLKLFKKSLRVHTLQSEKRQGCKTENVLFNFCINTTYKQLNLLISRPLSQSFGKEKLDVIEQNRFHIRHKQKKSLLNVGNLFLGFFLQSSVIIELTLHKNHCLSEHQKKKRYIEHYWLLWPY